MICEDIKGEAENAGDDDHNDGDDYYDDDDDGNVDDDDDNDAIGHKDRESRSNNGLLAIRSHMTLPPNKRTFRNFMTFMKLIELFVVLCIRS